MKLKVEDIEEKLFHIRIGSTREISHEDFQKEVEIEFEVIDGPLAGYYLKTLVCVDVEERR